MTPLPRRVRVHAPAKINLTLRVLGIRPDGYHELRTTFQSLALHDTLTFTATRGPLMIECDDPACPADRTNLVWRSADALWTARGNKGEAAGVHVRIQKRIPMQAGLGGGSSDAAASLRALNALWRTRATADELRIVAKSLGADVSYFLEGGLALGVDRGDELFPLVDGPASWVVVALPDFGVSTAEAYRWWDERTKRRDPTPLRTRLHNDLQAPVVARHPRIGRLVNQLRRLGAAGAAMSGSGSAVFGLFDREAVARRAALGLANRRCTTYVTRTVNHRGYRALTRIR